MSSILLFAELLAVEGMEDIVGVRGLGVEVRVRARVGESGAPGLGEPRPSYSSSARVPSLGDLRRRSSKPDLSSPVALSGDSGSRERRFFLVRSLHLKASASQFCCQQGEEEQHT